jgi:superfamily II DNA/RNA helicase
MDPRIRKLAKAILHDPTEVSTAIAKPADGVMQVAYLVHEEQKISLINKLLSDKPDYTSILIFSSTKKKVGEIARSLTKHGNTAKGISSDLEQKEREEVLRGFRSRQTRILVATDVLSRGIDIKDIHLIVNFDVPQDAEDYVHRVGRTARADNTGVAITLINEADMFRFHRIEELIEMNILKLPVPEELGESPEWNIWRKPRQKKFRNRQNNKHKSHHKKKHYRGKKNH